MVYVPHPVIIDLCQCNKGTSLSLLQPPHFFSEINEHRISFKQRKDMDLRQQKNTPILGHLYCSELSQQFFPASLNIFILQTSFFSVLFQNKIQITREKEKKNHMTKEQIQVNHDCINFFLFLSLGIYFLFKLYFIFSKSAPDKTRPSLPYSLL